MEKRLLLFIANTKNFSLLNTQMKRGGKSFIFAVCRKRHAQPLYCQKLGLTKWLTYLTWLAIFMTRGEYCLFWSVAIFTIFWTPLVLRRYLQKDDDTSISYATLSRGITWNFPRVTCILISQNTRAFRRVCIPRKHKRQVRYLIVYHESSRFVSRIEIGSE